MFLNFGTFDTQPQPLQHRMRNQQPRQQQGHQQIDIFGRLGNFLQRQFMNFRNNQRQEPQGQQAEPHLEFHRFHGKKQSDNKKQSMNKQTNLKTNYPPNTGMYWKQKANEQFLKGNNQKALLYYSKAIQLNNTQSIFFSNRAICHKKLLHYQQAFKDAQQSIELDTNNIKGFLVCGQTLAQLGKNQKNIKKVSNAIIKLTKALTLCTKQNKSKQFQYQIGVYIYRAKKLLWFLKFEQIKQKRITVINQYKNYLQKDQKLDRETAAKKLAEFVSSTNQLHLQFYIPHHFICPLTFDLMEDPVVVSSGKVYQRQMIQSSIEKNGKIDPSTRKPITGDLYPCFALKQAISEFLQKNPWAYQFREGQTYTEITF